MKVYLVYNLYLKPKTSDTKEKKNPNYQDSQGIHSSDIRPTIKHVFF